MTTTIDTATNSIKNDESGDDETIFTNKFDRTFQEKIVQAMLHDKEWASQFQEVLKVEYFQYAHLKLITSKYLDYYKTYREFPSVELFSKTILREELKRLNNDALTNQVRDIILKVSRNEDLGDLKFVKEKSLDFCKKVGLQNALEKSVDLIKTEKYEKIVDTIKTALAAGNSNTEGISLCEENDIEARYSETYRETIPTGIPELDQRKILNGGLGQGEIGIVVAPSGCHAKGTKILMLDGSLKNVEDIQVGDKLMGPDSKERNVLKLVRGNEKMYEIIPTKGESFTVNENHILSLKRTGGCNPGGAANRRGDIVNVSVKEYLQKSNTFKNHHKLYRPKAIEFTTQSTRALTVDPYMLGVLIGDGYISKGMIEVTTADKEISDATYEHAKSMGMNVSAHHKEGTIASGFYYTNNGKHKNALRDSLTELGLMESRSGTKFIPEAYKTATIEERLQMLAGLIDTDGFLQHRCFEFTSKSRQLAEDVIYVARSVGLAAQLNKTKLIAGVPYYRLSISGDTEIIPTKLPRKQVTTTRKQIKGVRHLGFQARELPGSDDYYGFTVDSDNLYVMGNFFVTHNCGKSQVLVHFGAQALKQGKNVVYYTYELNERLVGIRFDSHLTKIDSLECFEQKDKIKDYYATNQERLGRLRIKYYPTGSASVITLQAHLDKLATTGFVPDLILVDYAGIMRSTERHDLLRHEMKKVIEELRQFADEHHLPIWTALQSNKEGMNADFIDMTNMAESFGQAAVADLILGLSRKSNQKSTGIGTLFIAKNRFGVDGVQYKVHLDTARSTLRVLTEDEMADYQQSTSEGTQEAFSILRKKFNNV